MKKFIILIVVTMNVAVLGMALSTSTVDAGVTKVNVCHVPPGNAQNMHTINVGYPSITAHIDHGDYLGECTSSELDPCDLDANVNDCVEQGIYY